MISDDTSGAIYVDLKSVYISPKDNSDSLEPPLTHFGNVCKQLGIKLIKAYSPQAKGCVERKHAVYQDRLVKEIKLRQYCSIDQVNQFLQQTFLQQINKRYAKPPKNNTNAHITAPSADALYNILCIDQQRRLQNDWTISYNARCLQIEEPCPANLKPKSIINIKHHLDQTTSLWFHEQKLNYTQIDYVPLVKPRKGYSSLARSRAGKIAKKVSPWGKFNPAYLNTKSVTNIKCT